MARKSPNHTLVLPFTRLLGSPMDFTPGIFDLLLDSIDNHKNIEFPVMFTVIDSRERIFKFQVQVVNLCGPIRKWI